MKNLLIIIEGLAADQRDEYMRRLIETHLKNMPVQIVRTETPYDGLTMMDRVFHLQVRETMFNAAETRGDYLQTETSADGHRYGLRLINIQTALIHGHAICIFDRLEPQTLEQLEQLGYKIMRFQLGPEGAQDIPKDDGSIDPVGPTFPQWQRGDRSKKPN